jgi:hypothetical protein
VLCFGPAGLPVAGRPYSRRHLPHLSNYQTPPPKITSPQIRNTNVNCHAQVTKLHRI